jgi:hypothetical protein
MRVLVSLVALALMTTSAVGQTNGAQNLTGAVSARTPRVSFQVQLEAGEIVTLTTSSSANLDTVLALTDPRGQRVAENDDVQQGILTSRIVYVARATGRHTAIVSGYNNATGPFELNIRRGLDVGLSDAARTLRDERLTFSANRREFRYPVDLSDGDIFVASTFALTENLDTTLSLSGPDGTILAQNDDRGDGTLNSQLIFEAARTGRYEVVVSTYGGEGQGDFALSLATDPNAEAPFNFATIEGTQIARYEGELNAAQTSREYTVNLAAGQTLLAVADTTSGNLDTVLRLSGADGFPVALNDDRGDGSLNSAFAYTAPHAGRYRLEINRYAQADTSGAYRLVLSSVDRSVVATVQALFENAVTLSGAEQIIETADFRVHYTTEGRDAASPDYVRSVANSLQSTYDTQISRLGWAAPPRDPDGRYRAYVAEANGDMGYTKPVQILFDNVNTPNVRERAAARTVVVIENDFLNSGKEASAESLGRATAVHEFNHAVQFGYDSEEGLDWLYESTASWMETIAAGADQDATDYVETDYETPQLCWTTSSRSHAYAQWTLLESLADAHGEGIVLRLWQNTVAYDGFETMSRTLAGAGTTIPDAIRRWRIQNFARDYDLAARFTRTVARAGEIARDGEWSQKGGGVQQLGANYIALRLQGRRAFEVRGDRNLELVALGQRNGQIEVVPLGRGGVFDTTGYQYAGLMVFNRAVPSAPGQCSDFRYSINVTPTNAAATAAQYQISAEHFAPPS